MCLSLCLKVVLVSFAYHCRPYDNFFTWADKLSDQNEMWPDIDTNCPDTELLMHVHLHCR